jgi:two-component system sensor histidine kinase YesM
VVWDIDDSVLQFPIVKVSLQPIIENAVYHGIKPLRTQGIITISILKVENQLIIKVSDNGVGMPKEEVTVLNEDMHKKYILNENHIGLRNVNQRLKLMMGDDAGLEIFSKEYEGTTVILILPVSRL